MKCASRGWVPSSRASAYRRAAASTASGADFLPGVSAEARSASAGAVLALGKFDALHLGHKGLLSTACRLATSHEASTSSKSEGDDAGVAAGLLSFHGMAEVLGWPSRRPLVAPLDRRRILESWTSELGLAPCRPEVVLPFAEIRELSPQAFVDLLADPDRGLGLSGVVAGHAFRFGFKQAGDTEQLLALGEAAGLKVGICDAVTHEELPVSSTRVRDALAEGNLDHVAHLLGRRHRVVLTVLTDREGGPESWAPRDDPRVTTALVLPHEGRSARGLAEKHAALVFHDVEAFNNLPPGPNMYRCKSVEISGLPASLATPAYKYYVKEPATLSIDPDRGAKLYIAEDHHKVLVDTLLRGGACSPVLGEMQLALEL